MKKRISLFLAAVMVFALLAACGTQTGGEGTTTSRVETTAAVTTQESAAAGPAWKEDTSPLDITWYTTNTQVIMDSWGTNLCSKTMKEKTGVNITFLPIGDANTKLSLMAASGDLPDVVESQYAQPAIQDMLKGKMFQPLNKLSEQYDPSFMELADPLVVKWYTYSDGNFYGYPSFTTSPDDKRALNMGNDVFTVRKDIYEALGMPDMRTPEGFVKALKDAKEKFPKALNGEPLIPFGTGEWDAQWGNAQLQGVLFKFLNIPFVENNEYVLERGVFNPEFQNWMKVIRSCNEQGLISKEIFTDKNEQIQAKAINGRYFALFYTRSLFEKITPNLEAAHPEATYIPIDAMLDSKLESPTFTITGLGGYMTPFITTKAKNPERIIKFFSYLLSDEGQMDMQMGVEGVSYSIVDGAAKFLPDIEKMRLEDPDKFNKEIGGVYNYGFFFNKGIRDTTYGAPVPYPDARELIRNYCKTNIAIKPEYGLPAAEAGSKEANAQNDWYQKIWVPGQVSLVTAKTEAEFDKIYKDLETKYRDVGMYDFEAWASQEIKKNYEKLGIK